MQAIGHLILDVCALQIVGALDVCTCGEGDGRREVGDGKGRTRKWGGRWEGRGREGCTSATAVTKIEGFLYLV